MIVLSLAIARPFFREAPVEALGDSDCHHFFVIDQSYSMAYKRAQHTSLDVAKRAALKVLQDIHPSEQDRFTILPLSSYPEPILVNSNRKERIQTAINELKPSDFGTSVHATMQSLRNLLESTEIKNRDRRIYLFTDLQRNGWMLRDDAEAKKFDELLKAFAKKDNTRFFLYDAGTPDAFNNAIVNLRANDRVITTRRITRFTASIHNFSSIPRPAVNVGFYVNDNLVKTEPAVLPPGATTPVTFEYRVRRGRPPRRPGLDRSGLPGRGRLALAGRGRQERDPRAGDRRRTQGQPQGERDVRLRPGARPARQGDIFSIDVKTVELFNAEGLDGYDFLVLANVQSLTSDRVEKIESFVRRGGGLFVSLGNRVDKVSFNEYFWKKGAGLSPAQLEEITGRCARRRHRAGHRAAHRQVRARRTRCSATFQKRTMAALYDLVFYKYYKVKDFDPEKVLAALDDNFASPLFLEKTLDERQGASCFTSTIDARVERRHPGPPAVPGARCGTCAATCRRAPPAGATCSSATSSTSTCRWRCTSRRSSWTRPRRARSRCPASAPERDQKFFRLFYPSRAKSDDPKAFKNEGVRNAGKYKLLRNSSKEEEKLVTYFAVNVGPREATPEEIQASEGNLERISKEEIQSRFPDFKIEFRGEKKDGANEIDMSPPPASGLWKYLMYFLVGFLLLESALACLFGRGK